MNKNKILVIVFICIFSCTLLFEDDIRAYFSFNNEEETGLIPLQSNKEYIFGQDIKSGRYDVLVMKGKVKVMYKNMVQGCSLSGMFFPDDFHISYTGKGKVALRKVGTRRLTKKKEVYWVDSSGEYIVGQEIAEGKYKLNYHSSDKNSKDKALISLYERKNNQLKWQKSIKKNTEITLKIGEILKVDKTFEEEDPGGYVCLEPIGK